MDGFAPAPGRSLTGRGEPLDQTGFRTVDGYLATFPDGVRESLQQVRRAIRDAVPAADERISYQMPTYQLGDWRIYFAGFKKHYSLFVPRPESVLEAFAAELSPYEVSNSTFKFPLNRPVPVDLIRNIAKHHAETTLARANAKPRDSG